MLTHRKLSDTEFTVVGWDAFRHAHQLRDNRTDEVMYVDIGHRGPELVGARVRIHEASLVISDIWFAHATKIIASPRTVHKTPKPQAA
jgi:hypothetical protein